MSAGRSPPRTLFSPLALFQPNVRFLLIAVFLDGIAVSGTMLFFNFFVLARGYGSDFLGLVNSIPAAVALLLGLPLGRLADRVGYRTGIVAGFAVSYSAYAVALVAPSPGLLIAAMALQGAGSTLYYLSVNPFLMKHSGKEERSMLFSVNVGLQSLAGAVGSLLAGQLPGWLGHLSHLSPGSMGSYQTVLLFGLATGAIGLIPLFLTRNPPMAEGPGVERIIPQDTAWTSQEKWSTVRMGIPNLLIGFGAALIIPYMNVFFRARFSTPDSLLGVLFSLSAVLTGLATVFAPWVMDRLGSKIRAVTFTQAGSLIFLVILGFSPAFSLTAAAFLVRAALMNMSVPLYSAFCMERAPEGKRGVVNSVIQIAWQAGWAIGPFISGFVQARWGFPPLFVATAIFYGLAVTAIGRFFGSEEGRIKTAPAG
jgi:MFS family permease